MVYTFCSKCYVLLYQGDYTRTGERKFSGLMKDGMNSANRYNGEDSNARDDGNMSILFKLKDSLFYFDQLAYVMLSKL